MNRLTAAGLKVLAVVAIAGGGAALGGYALGAPGVGLGDGDYEGITVWSDVPNAPVWVDLRLDPTGRVDISVVSEFPSAPSLDDSGEWVASDPVEQETMDGPPVEGIASVVILQLQCGSDLRADTVEMSDPVSYEFGGETTATVDVDGGGDCSISDLEIPHFQTITVRLERVADVSEQRSRDPQDDRVYRSGVNAARFSAMPTQAWTDSSIDERVARTPPMLFGVFQDGMSPPEDAQPVGPFSRFDVTDDGRLSDVVDLAIPAAGDGDALSQSMTWRRDWDLHADFGIQDRMDATYVRWVDPAGSSVEQGMLLAAGVLLGVATSLAIEFLLPSRVATKAERSLDASSRVLTDASGVMVDASGLLDETQSLLAEKRRGGWLRSRTRRRGGG